MFVSVLCVVVCAASAACASVPIVPEPEERCSLTTQGCNFYGIGREEYDNRYRTCQRGCGRYMAAPEFDSCRAHAPPRLNQCQSLLGRQYSRCRPCAYYREEGTVVTKYITRTVEKEVPVIVEKPVPQPYYVERKVEVPVPVYHRVPVEKPVYIEKKVPHPVYVDREVHVPVPVDRPVPVVQYVDRPVPHPVYVDRAVPVPHPVVVEKPVVVHTPPKVIVAHTPSCDPCDTDCPQDCVQQRPPAYAMPALSAASNLPAYHASSLPGFNTPSNFCSQCVEKCPAYCGAGRFSRPIRMHRPGRLGRVVLTK